MLAEWMDRPDHERAHRVRGVGDTGHSASELRLEPQLPNWVPDCWLLPILGALLTYQYQGAASLMRQRPLDGQPQSGE